jgi:hypothetical protein
MFGEEYRSLHIVISFKFVLRNGCMSLCCVWLDESLVLLYSFSYFALTLGAKIRAVDSTPLLDTPFDLISIWVLIQTGCHMPTACENPQLKTSKIIKVYNLQFNTYYFQQNSTSKTSKHMFTIWPVRLRIYDITVLLQAAMCRLSQIGPTHILLHPDTSTCF